MLADSGEVPGEPGDRALDIHVLGVFDKVADLVHIVEADPFGKDRGEAEIAMLEQARALVIRHPHLAVHHERDQRLCPLRVTPVKLLPSDVRGINSGTQGEETYVLESLLARPAGQRLR